MTAAINASPTKTRYTAKEKQKNVGSSGVLSRTNRNRIIKIHEFSQICLRIVVELFATGEVWEVDLPDFIITLDQIPLLDLTCDRGETKKYPTLLEIL